MRHVTPLLLSLLLGAAAPAALWAQDTGLRGPLSDEPERDDVFATDTDGTDDAADDGLGQGRPRQPIFDDLPDEESPGGRRRNRAERAADAAEEADPLRSRAERVNVPRRDARPQNNTRAQRAERATRVGARRVDGSISPLANSPTLTLQGGFTRPPPEPFEPLGVRLGPLRVTGVFEQSLGYTTNADFARDGNDSVVSDTRTTLTAVTDLPVHEFRGTLRAGRQEFLNGESEGTPTVDAEGVFRYDLRRDTAVRVGATYSFTTESASDDDLVVPAGVELEERPGVHRYSAFVEGERTGGRLTGRARATVAREEYEDARFTNGTQLSQDDRDVTIFRSTLRVGYERTAALQPFVEGEIGYRLHDLRVDSAGFVRDGTLYGLRAGIALDFGAKLSGEIAAGLEGFIYESNRLENIVGPSASGALTWSPDALTTVTGTLTTRLDAATTAGQSGSLLYDGVVEATRDVRPNLALSGLVGVAYEDFDGEREDLTWRTEVSALWRLNRTLGITGRLGYLKVDSTDPFSTYDAATATVGLRLQR